MHIIYILYRLSFCAAPTWNSANVLAKQTFEILSFKHVKFMNWRKYY